MGNSVSRNRNQHRFCSGPISSNHRITKSRSPKHSAHTLHRSNAVHHTKTAMEVHHRWVGEADDHLHQIPRKPVTLRPPIASNIQPPAPAAQNAFPLHPSRSNPPALSTPSIPKSGGSLRHTALTLANALAEHRDIRADVLALNPASRGRVRAMIHLTSPSLLARWPSDEALTLYQQQVARLEREQREHQRQGEQRSRAENERTKQNEKEREKQLQIQRQAKEEFSRWWHANDTKCRRWAEQVHPPLPSTHTINNKPDATGRKDNQVEAVQKHADRPDEDGMDVDMDIDIDVDIDESQARYMDRHCDVNRHPSTQGQPLPLRPARRAPRDRDCECDRDNDQANMDADAGHQQPTLTLSNHPFYANANAHKNRDEAPAKTEARAGIEVGPETPMIIAANTPKSGILAPQPRRGVDIRGMEMMMMMMEE